MKVGSLVICPDGYPSAVPHMPILPASESIIYTVIDIDDGEQGQTLLNFEEIGYSDEWGYDALDFIEIQPPMDFTELLEETKVRELVNQ